MRVHVLICSQIATNEDGETPLSLASAGGQLDTVKYLVEVHHCDPRSEFITAQRTISYIYHVVTD